ncbi:helix-turn-helix transcriptional regulator [Barrientosiimonas humi]|uniref:helix-turn-helix transcriptional regulator n=1 Tax=Barrientosiimonas humi TaxID=999931 RepID=UPI00370DA115
MRADRLVSLVLLLRQNGGLTTATALAKELEVTPRTVLRDIEALSAAGVPVYSERGRRGGFALLPGFGTQLAGLNHDEALALLVAASGRGQAFGLGSALSSAVRKVVDSLPEAHRSSVNDAARLLLVDPDADLVAHTPATEKLDTNAMATIRAAVLDGHKLRIHYAARDQDARWRTVDPLGLVTVRGRGYLLAMREDQQRTYRLARVLAAEELEDPSDRPDRVDLDLLWRERCAAYLQRGEQVTARVLVDDARRDELVTTALAVRVEDFALEGRLRLEVTWQDSEHAEFALWRLASAATVLEPRWLRDALRNRATQVADHYAASIHHELGP